MGGGVGGGVAEGGTGSGQGDDAAGGVAEDGPQGIGCTLAAVVGQAEVLLDTRAGVGMDVGGGERILPLSHGFLLKCTWWYKSLSGGGLRLSASAIVVQAEPETTETGKSHQKIHGFASR